MKKRVTPSIEQIGLVPAGIPELSHAGRFLEPTHRHDDNSQPKKPELPEL